MKRSSFKLSGNVKAGHGRRSNVGISASVNGRTRAVSSIFASVENPRFDENQVVFNIHVDNFRFNGDRGMAKAQLPALKLPKPTLVDPAGHPSPSEAPAAH